MKQYHVLLKTVGACLLVILFYVYFPREVFDSSNHEISSQPIGQQPHQTTPDENQQAKIDEFKEAAGWIPTKDKEEFKFLTTTVREAASCPTTSTDSAKPFTTQTWSSSDGLVKHYILERNTIRSTTDPSVLFLTITRDAESWGRNPTEQARTFYNHLDLVTNTTLSPKDASLGILSSSREEFERYVKILTPGAVTGDVSERGQDEYFDYEFGRVVVILHMADTRAELPGTTKAQSDTSRGARHNVPQHERRAILAKLRNYLQFVALADETHVAWLDSDVYKFSDKSMIEVMAKKTTTTDEHEVGVLTARCRKGEPDLADAWMKQHPDFQLPNEAKNSDSEAKKKEIEEMRGKEGGRYEIMAHKTHAMGHYDLNAWAGRRTGPNNMQQEALWDDISAWTPSGADRGLTKILDGVISGTSNSDVRMLDSVGGTIIVIRAELIKMGLIFPTGYFVGMTFEHGEGYDGIETEGLCLLTRSFSRDRNSTCYTLGGDWSVWHTVF